MKSTRSVCIALALPLLLAGAASANPITYTATPYTGSPAQVEVRLEQTAADQVTVTLSVNTAVSLADLRGFFFNVAGSPTGVAVAGPDVTQFVADAYTGAKGSGVQNLGGGNTISPEGPFDVGVEIGGPGLKGGADDIGTTTFTVSRPGGLSVADLTSVNDPVTGGGLNELLFAVRLTSVGTGNSREGSSKLGVTTGNIPPLQVPDPDVIPEPATLGTFGLLAVAGAALYRRRGSAELVRRPSGSR